MTNNTSHAENIRENGFPGMYDLKKIWNPTWFQGNRRKKNYFEGWYFKVVSQDQGQSWAFIPGISLALNDEHSFVQVINGKTGETWYYRFPLDAFAYSKDGFDIRVGNNHFSASHMELELESEAGRFTGNFSFTGRQAFNTSWRKPGIMGWYRYVPFMECYHGVVSLSHDVEGMLISNQQKIPFGKGRGYIEKDWGSSMPEAWLWMQSNHFNDANTSLMLSVARIPWIGKTFTGFLGFFLHQGKRYDFATYTGAKLKLDISETGNIAIHISNKEFNCAIHARQVKAGALKAPVQGNMQRVIHESIDATIKLRFNDLRNHVTYEGSGSNAGLEVTGDYQLLLS